MATGGWAIGAPVLQLLLSTARSSNHWGGDSEKALEAEDFSTMNEGAVVLTSIQSGHPSCIGKQKWTEDVAWMPAI